MKPRERVLAALNHEEPDRCPLQVSFTPEFARRLQEDLRLKGLREHNPHGGGNLYEIERALGEDMISPELWRRFFKPRLASFWGELKQMKPGLKIAYHSDGFIEPIIPDLIELGLDVLNPVQPASMDPATLKKKYGRQLCFWGSLDEQHTLPFGTPAEVRREILDRLGSLGAGGGLIIGPTHHVQLDTPLPNFWAMIETVRDTPYSALKAP